jgi:hypothetical protein
MDRPYGFVHELDPDLSALDRIEALSKRAPEGKAGVQLADDGREPARPGRPGAPCRPVR